MLCTFKTLEGFKQLNQSSCAELFVVLGCHLNTDLQVLANVVGKHGAQAFQGIFH